MRFLQHFAERCYVTDGLASVRPSARTFDSGSAQWKTGQTQAVGLSDSICHHPVLSPCQTAPLTVSFAFSLAQPSIEVMANTQTLIKPVIIVGG